MSTFGLPIADFPETCHGHDVRLHTIYLGNLGLRGQFHVGWRYTADLGVKLWGKHFKFLRPQLTFHDINSQLIAWIAYASSLSFHLFDCPLIAPSLKTHLHDINIDRWKYELQWKKELEWAFTNNTLHCSAPAQNTERALQYPVHNSEGRLDDLCSRVTSDPTGFNKGSSPSMSLIVLRVVHGSDFWNCRVLRWSPPPWISHWSVSGMEM